VLYGARIYGGGLKRNLVGSTGHQHQLAGSGIERDTQVDDQLGNIAGREQIARV
jgi:hypothetical protein